MKQTTKKTPNTTQLYAFGKKRGIDLSLSENPLGFSPLVKQYLNTAELEVSQYPDPKLTSLRKKIARRNGLEVENIVVGSGSEALLAMLPRVVDRGLAVMPELTFPMFKIVSLKAGLEIRQIAMEEDLGIDLDAFTADKIKGASIVFLCSPNNPTGEVLDKKKVLEFVDSTEALVVVDEANIEFGGETIIGEVKKFDNLVVVRTFSKGFGLAGIRLGFCAANPEIVERIEQQQQPFPVTSISVRLAELALDDDQFIKRTKDFMKQEREFLTSQLRTRGFRVIDSQANNLFIDVTMFASSSTEFVGKLEEEDVSVVDGASFGFDSFIRVSPRMRSINKKFLQAIDRVRGIVR